MHPIRKMAVPSLTRWGLSPDADMVYRTLVLHGASPAVALARELGVDRARIDRALHDLRDFHAVYQEQAQWRAIPTPVLLEQRPSVAAPLRIDVGELGPGLIYLPSRQACRDRLSQLVGIARHEELTMYPEESFEPAVIKAATPMVQQLVKRGIHMRVLGMRGNPDLRFADEAWPTPPSVSYRETSQLPMKLFVIDRKVALFPVNPANHEQGYLEVSQQPIVDSLVATFERHWAQAQEVVSAFGLTPREEAVIALLCRGHTDAAAARELRVSERSVSTIIRSIMDRLGVTNRFQLGLALGALGVAQLPRYRQAAQRDHASGLRAAPA